MEAQDALPVEQYVGVIAPLKTCFTNHDAAKGLLHDVLADFGCDPAVTYFDVPKLRIVTHSGYLTAGVGYAYTPHRDTWYAAPPCQLNWWLPITEISSENALAFHPEWWSEPVPNSSAGFDYYEWNKVGRVEAAQHIESDARNIPVATEPIDFGSGLRVVGEPASTLTFSAAQLHSSVPNTSGRTRFSIDFRTVNLQDMVERRGAPNIDSASTGTTARDFLRATDCERLPDDVVAVYETGSTVDGPLVFDPATLVPLRR